MSQTDCLQALQQAIKANTPISYTTSANESTTSLLSASQILIGSTPFPKDAPTRYTRPTAAAGGAGDPVSSPSNFFSLSAVYLAWLMRDTPGAEYMKAARENGLTVGFVSVTERKAVVEWLEGKGSGIGRVVPIAGETTTPPGSPLASPRRPVSPSKRAHGTTDAVSSPSKRPYVADTADLEVVKRIRANEVELRDRNTVLRGVKSNNFSALHLMYSDKIKKLKEGKPATSATPSASAGNAMQPRKAKHTYPIIVISSSPTSLITMHNVKRFLQESTFELSADARAREGNARAEDVVHIDRLRPSLLSNSTQNGSGSGAGKVNGATRGQMQRYFVVDGVEALNKFGTDAWDRVVCVMTTGQTWQFRPYKWSDPRTLFHHVKGVYVTWTNDPPNTKIKDWNVTELKIDPHRRHVDKSVVAHFWRMLDDWTLANKPWLIKA
ncbi:RNA polymerase II-associated protein [Coniophora puteana RWD-64-598 SS2]|uniref:RNA polymerase II-associated protein n=1 Tax=Coniophora puteana (strain RWD-64-598) TaxID=741705 RepID=A0A5M3N355_CONPW|nr:RNA polymerase II-associated protein [Coniophora puteana RWD-64-598 SS2]EIW85820.1 RNA polymerase II-associated protein [Coniophora puteana RWD-64-598 SS2]